MKTFKEFTNKIVLSAAILLVTLGMTGVASAAELDGKKLFKSNCASCHAPHKDLTGPKLKGVRNKVPEGDWIYQWVRNNQALIDAGDEYAVEISAFNPTAMNAFPALSNEEIDAILDYADAFEAPVAAATEQANLDPYGEEVVEIDPIHVGMITVVLIVLVVGLIVFSRLSRVLGDVADDVVDGKVVSGSEELEAKERLKFDRFSIQRVLSSKIVVVPVIILIVCTIFGGLWDGATGLGRSMDYAPDQPIAFSHKIHAGDNKIDCQYCHSSARQGKASMIPSLNVCMNCHKAITTYGEKGDEKLWNGAVGTDEIRKIYTHLGLDENGKEDPNLEPTPIAWERIHNLPDHVYFNHSQHVVAGKQECQTCHGEVEKMNVLQKKAPLSMGWCVNCHRETDVKFNNEYYSGEGFEDLHNQLKDGEKSSIKVSDIGGTECQKCHY